MVVDVSDELNLDELKALGVILVLEAADAAFPLKIDSLERLSAGRERKPWWLLLTVIPASEDAGERAVVWVSDEYRVKFLDLFEDFLAKQTQGGQPKNRELVANIGSIRSVTLHDLWQSEGDPPTGIAWWELWLTTSNATTDGLALLRDWATLAGHQIADRHLALPDRMVTWIQAQWTDLVVLPFTSVPLAEIRRPSFVDTILDFPAVEQDELAVDLVGRVQPAGSEAPAVCHLNTGVQHSHLLLADSLDAADAHSVVDATGADNHGHGTKMGRIGPIRAAGRPPAELRAGGSAAPARVGEDPSGRTGTKRSADLWGRDCSGDGVRRDGRPRSTTRFLPPGVIRAGGPTWRALNLVGLHRRVECRLRHRPVGHRNRIARYA